MKPFDESRPSDLSQPDPTELRNRRFYGELWSQAELVPPERFNTWPLVRALVRQAARRLEIAPGMRPRLPIAGTHFLDLTGPPLQRLAARGGHVVRGSVTAMPFASARFDLLAAFDIVEHVAHDAVAFAELGRLAAPGAWLLLSVPLHPQAWTPFDDLVGHHRRYRPADLLGRLREAGFTVAQSAAFGMQPRSPRLVGWGMRRLERDPARAMWWYNRFFMPVGLRLARRLRLRPGFAIPARVDTILLVCRKDGARQSQARQE